MSCHHRVALALASTLAGVALCAGTAAAAPGADPVAGDDRATAHAGNVVAAGCAALVPGSHDVTAALTTADDGTHLDVTAVADGVEVVGVVVKGGPAYNVYAPADLGGLPWLDLHSPLNASGGPAGISHWFACGTDARTTTTTTGTTTTGTTTGTTGTTTTGTATETTTGSSSGETTTDAGGGSAVTTTTTSADVTPVAADEDLASTGFAGGWLAALAAGLLIAGGAVLLLLRVRARG